MGIMCVLASALAVFVSCICSCGFTFVPFIFIRTEKIIIINNNNTLNPQSLRKKTYLVV